MSQASELRLQKMIDALDDRVERLEKLEFSSSYFGCGVLIEDILLGADASPVTFDNIPQNYRHLQLILNYQSGGVPAYVRFNADSGSNYDYGGVRHGVQDSGSPVYVAYWYRPGSSPPSTPDTSWRAGGGMEDRFGVGYMYFGDYTADDKNKTGISHMPVRIFGEAEAPSLWMIEHHWCNWLVNDAITRIDVYSYIPGGGGSFITGSRFSLYGMC